MFNFHRRILPPFLAAIALCGQAMAETAKLTVTGSDCQLVSAKPGKKTIKVKVEGNTNPVQVFGEIYQYDQKKPCARSKKITISNTGTIEFDLRSTGFYEFTIIAKANDGKELDRVSSTYAVVPDNNYDHPREMGTCTHFGQGKGAYPLTFNLLNLAGFTRIRDDFSWQAIEPKPKKYQVPKRIEKLVNTAIKYKIKPLLVTGYGTRAYEGKYSNGFVNTPEMREAYGNAVVFAVKHFGNRVTEWELWNEPNRAHPVKHYLPMLKVVYPIVKKANPRATFISCGGGGAGGGPGGGMIIPIIKAGGVDFQDGFSIHPYMAPHDPDYGYGARGAPIPRVSVPVFAPFQKRIAEKNPKSNGRKLSVWVTELGWPTEHPSTRQHPTTEMLQAAFFARTYLMFRKENAVKGIFWYDFQNDGINPKEKEDNFGIIRKDFSPKPAYQAAAVVAWILRNRPYVRDLSPKDKMNNSKVYQYGQGKDRVIVAWLAAPEGSAKQSENINIKLPFSPRKAILLDWQGKKQKLNAKNGTVMLKTTYLPQYIVQK